jgi:hypothetical protein
LVHAVRTRAVFVGIERGVAGGCGKQMQPQHHWHAIEKKHCRPDATAAAGKKLATLCLRL